MLPQTAAFCCRFDPSKSLERQYAPQQLAPMPICLVTHIMTDTARLSTHASKAQGCCSNHHKMTSRRYCVADKAYIQISWTRPAAQAEAEEIILHHVNPHTDHVDNDSTMSDEGVMCVHYMFEEKRLPADSSFINNVMGHKGTFHLSSAYSVPTHIDHIINSPCTPPLHLSPRLSKRQFVTTLTS